MSALTLDTIREAAATLAALRSNKPMPDELRLDRFTKLYFEAQLRDLAMLPFSTAAQPVHAEGFRIVESSMVPPDMGVFLQGGRIVGFMKFDGDQVTVQWLSSEQLDQLRRAVAEAYTVPR